MKITKKNKYKIFFLIVSFYPEEVSFFLISNSKKVRTIEYMPTYFIKDTLYIKISTLLYTNEI